MRKAAWVTAALLAVWAVLAVPLWLPPAQHVFGFYSGAGNSPQYLFWSGAGSDLAYLSFAWGALLYWRKHNCHEPGCWRLGRVAVDERGTLSCWHHHPDGRPRRGHVGRAHEDFQQRWHLYAGERPGKG